jgi:hypothetical protein
MLANPSECVVGRRTLAREQQPPLFRTVQVCSKDLLTCLPQAGSAANRLRQWRSLAGMIGGGTRGTEPHVRHQAAGVHHAARRRGGGVAASGTRAAARDAGDRVLLRPTSWRRYDEA